jgi:hypothetical protein
VIELQWIDLSIVTETEVRDHIAQVDVMLGQAAAPSQMHTKQIDERQSPTGKRIIARLASQILYCLLAVEAIAAAKEIVISIDHTEAAATIQWATMTANDEIERMSVRNSTAAEVTREEASMNYLGATRNRADDEELIVTAKVLEAQG